MKVQPILSATSSSNARLGFAALCMLAPVAEGSTGAISSFATSKNLQYGCHNRALSSTSADRDRRRDKQVLAVGRSTAVSLDLSDYVEIALASEGLKPDRVSRMDDAVILEFAANSKVSVDVYDSGVIVVIVPKEGGHEYYELSGSDLDLIARLVKNGRT